MSSYSKLEDFPYPLPEKITYKSANEGPVLAIFGAVHGNEKCGTAAIQRLIGEFDTGNLTLARGRVILLPIANPGAYEKDVRFIDRNLNRYLTKDIDPKGYEDFLNPHICSTLDDADILLDLHSYESEGEEFIFLGESDEENEFAKSLGVSDFVYGWSEAFASSSAKGSAESIGTTEYIRQKGGLGITLECGHHNNNTNLAVGYEAIIRALKHLDMIAEEWEDVASNDNQPEMRCVKMQTVFYKEHEGQWTKAWKHYDAVSEGEVLAEYDNGEKITAPEDGFIVLPKAHAKIGGEWFYFGIGTDFPTY